MTDNRYAFVGWKDEAGYSFHERRTLITSRVIFTNGGLPLNAEWLNATLMDHGQKLYEMKPAGNA